MTCHMAFLQKNLQKLLARVPRGKVTTYTEIARALGSPKGARAAGNLLNKNPKPNIFPCYKVVKNNGEIGGYALGEVEKIQRLQNDGVKVQNGKVIDFENRRFLFS